MDVYVGDKVQIRNGGMDVTNGYKAKAGKMYGENGPLWAEVVLIDPSWPTGGKFSLPKYVTKVRCAKGGVVVWQVQPQDIADNIIRGPNAPTKVQVEPTPAPPASPPATDIGKEELTIPDPKVPASQASDAFVMTEGSENWQDGTTPRSAMTGSLSSATRVSTKVISASKKKIGEDMTYSPSGTWRDPTPAEAKIIGPNVQIDQGALTGAAKFKTVVEDPVMKRQLLSQDVENIQNVHNFPKISTPASGMIAQQYDYQIIPNDPNFPLMKNLENELMKARAAFGIPVHGNNEIARAMKYYMYNRFKVPDINLAHNKTVTHVFFTRPDLNILIPGVNGGANSQVKNHTEAAMVWRRYPEIFKLLTDSSRCGDSDNFNMLLSNQVRSFDIRDEQLNTLESGKSWNEYSMIYGDSYTGRTAGQFSCNFEETSDYSVINLIKLWITYIDNVARGAWSPSYNLNGTGVSTSYPDYSHVYTKTLDYAASAYVFKCGPDGEDVLYWSKYYGVFPISTGAGALSWDQEQSIGNGPKLNIQFAYSFKKDMSPISLLEFNHNARVSGTVTAEESFNPEYNHSSRPFVGTPFIQMKLRTPTLTRNGVNYMKRRSEIRLKFKKYSDPKLTDSLLYRSSLG
ncbi:MAG: hypothetical protein NC489_24565 [Ruminococcus flavefaciens]|nr:hypothetical protein [Ruminococcus flavefaciens]